MSSPRIQAWSGSATRRNFFCMTASARTWLQARWCSATLRSLRLSTLGGVLSGDRGDLVADRQDGVQGPFAGDVEVALQLFGGELVRPGLDLDQGCPGPAPRLTRMSPSGSSFLSPSRNGTSMQVSIV